MSAKPASVTISTEDRLNMTLDDLVKQTKAEKRKQKRFGGKKDASMKVSDGIKKKKRLNVKQKSGNAVQKTGERSAQAAARGKSARIEKIQQRRGIANQKRQQQQQQPRAKNQQARRAAERVRERAKKQQLAKATRGRKQPAAARAGQLVAAPRAQQQTRPGQPRQRADRLRKAFAKPVGGRMRARMQQQQQQQRKNGGGGGAPVNFKVPSPAPSGLRITVVNDRMGNAPPAVQRRRGNTFASPGARPPVIARIRRQQLQAVATPPQQRALRVVGAGGKKRRQRQQVAQQAAAATMSQRFAQVRGRGDVRFRR